MNFTRVLFAVVAAAGLGVFVHAAADSEKVAAEELARVRNLAKAYYENPTQKQEAVAEFAKAVKLAPESLIDRLNYGLALLRAGDTDNGLKQLRAVQEKDPSIPHTWFNLGIEYKKLGNFEEATEQLEQMARLVPEEPVTQYNLGVLYKRAGREEAAIKKFQIAAQLDPSLAAPHFQLFNSYRTSGRKEEAERELELFKQIKEDQKGDVIGEDMNWCFFSEVYEVIEPREAGATPEPVQLSVTPLEGEVEPKSAGMTVLDVNQDGKPDLVVWSENGIRLYADGVKPREDSGLEVAGAVTSAAPGDFDNDGTADLAVTTAAGTVLFRNEAGRFVKTNVEFPRRRFEKAVWLDYDHDNDIDLFLLGAKPALMRNEGAAGFAERTEDFPFANAHAIDAVAFRVEPDTKMYDLVVSHADGSGAWYVDRLAGKYTVRSLFEMPAGARGLRAVDFDNDSRFDVAFSAGGESKILRNLGGKLSPVTVPARGAPVFADLDNRGYEDMIAGGVVYRNLGEGNFTGGDSPPALREANGARGGAAADFNGDQKVDLVLIGDDGVVRLFENQSGATNRWLRVALTGRKAPKLAPGSEVEVKRGLRYQKKEYRGFPLLFGLGQSTQVDTVRITWSNGLIQNTTEQPSNQAVTYEEEERLSGSCPMIWTWNGRGFEFISDVLGVGPLGVRIGENEFFPADHDEYVQLPEGSLAQQDGQFEVRMTQELAEVVYMDEVKLLAVDHPKEIEVFTNEQFSVPPPEFKLWGVSERVHPRRAVDAKGQEVRARLAAKDGLYVDGFERAERRGVARMHALELDFGHGPAPANDAVLVLSGWVDWADGSTYLGNSQENPHGLVIPYLQVKNSLGEWETVVDQMGIPAGLPKTVVVDLQGKFLSDSRQVRIVTNMCLFWDEIFLALNATEPEARVTVLRSEQADVRFRGFSRIKVDPAGVQPQSFFYDRPEPAAMWNQTPGMYTRYGDVTGLLAAADDRFVVYGAGDEVRLRFDSTALPPLENGWMRTFVLGVDGWEKDQDPNTITSQSVEPLPFHGMSRYPYPADESHPDPEYTAEYNTRPARQLLKPLARAAKP